VCLSLAVICDSPAASIVDFMYLFLNLGISACSELFRLAVGLFVQVVNPLELLLHLSAFLVVLFHKLFDQ